MRELGRGGTTTKGVGDTEINMEVTMASLVQVWNEQEIQLMVLLSFMLQLFLLFTGSLRRRNTNGLLRVTVWLAYVGADLVAVFAIGLFSRYEDKYKSGQHSFGDTLPLLWAPFLLVHLGGQDTITAFSIEDNNLWLRHLLNLVIEVTLTLYVFWKSIHRINSQLLVIAIFIFVAGIIKYGERTWALWSGSRDGLGKYEEQSTRQHNGNANSSQASYALQTVLCARGLFVGRTILQLGDQIRRKLTDDFQKYNPRQVKLKIIVMELRMMYDLLYTKAMVLQRWTGIIFRCVAQISMVVAFVLFLKTEKHAHSRVNVAISYTLFVGAIFMEACSVSMVIVSPWTTASKEGNFIYRLFGNAWSLFKGIQCNKMQWSSNSMGQFNFIDSSISEKSTPTLISKVIGAFGLERRWRNLWYIKHIEAKEITEYIMEWFDRLPKERFRGLELGQKLNYTLSLPELRQKLNFTLSLPFEHALYRLHIYTDLHISKHLGSAGSRAADVMALKKECEKLSNYMIYLMAVYPSMLPVSSAAQDLGPGLLDWIRKCDETTKLEILKKYESMLCKDGVESKAASPFELVRDDQADLKRSLEDIKEMWVRLLVYAAGKCRGELHALQLGNGGELLTFVWLLMVHHGLGDVATELNLLTSNDPHVPEPGSMVPIDRSSWRLRLEGPIYAFDFCQNSSAGESPMREQFACMMQQISQRLISVGMHAAADIQQIGELIDLLREQNHEAVIPVSSLLLGIERNEAGASHEQIVGTSEIQQDDNVRDSAN